MILRKRDSWGFLAFHNLEWLFILCVISIFVGIFIACYPKSYEYFDGVFKTAAKALKSLL